MEAIDGVAILISQGAVQPCDALLRSGFEALAGIRYIMAEDSYRRGVAFFVSEIHRHIKRFRQCDPDDEMGKDMRRRLPAESVAVILDQLPAQEARQRVEDMRADLEQPPLKAINQEWQRVKAASKGDPAWYSLFGGPKNIQQLAEKVNLTVWYEFLYRQWSGFTHAANCLRNLQDSPESILLRPLRHPEGVIPALRFAVILTAPVTVEIFKKYVPDSTEAAERRSQQLLDAVKAHEGVADVAWKAKPR
jgi:hypothetical protein